MDKVQGKEEGEEGEEGRKEGRRGGSSRDNKASVSFAAVDRRTHQFAKAHAFLNLQH